MPEIREEDARATDQVSLLQEVGSKARKRRMQGWDLVGAALALLRKKTKEDWTNIEACHKEAGTEKHRLYHCPGWYEVRREIQAFISESKKRKLRKGLEVAKKYFYASSQ